MDALENATPEEEAELPNWICTFHRWMLAGGKKEGTAKAYASQIRMLYEDDGKGPAAMATQEYFALTKASYKNRLGNGQRSAAVRLFVEFHAEHTATGAQLQMADGSKIYQVKPRSETESRRQRHDDKVAPDMETPDAKRLRSDLDLPSDWRVLVRERSSGDLLAAVSPGGRAYSSRQAVDDRLGRDGGSGGSAGGGAPPAPPPTPAALVAALAATTPTGPPVRRTLPLPEALGTALACASAADSAGSTPAGKHAAFLVSGRDPSKSLTPRLLGLYVAEESQALGRPIYKKADQEKPTLFFYNEEKNLWRISYALDAPAAFGKIKEKVDAPWEITKVWKIFNGNGAFDEDPDLKVTLLDPENLPQDVKVEVCLPTCPAVVASASAAGASQPSSSSRKREREVPDAATGGDSGKSDKQDKKAKKLKEKDAGGKGGGANGNTGDIWSCLPEDAPEGHEAWERVKHDVPKSRAVMQAPCGGKKIAFQTTLSYCFGSNDALLVIARACYVQFAKGKSKEEVIEFRTQCYERLSNWDPNAPASSSKPEPAAPSSQPAPAAEAESAAAAAKEAPAEGGKKAKKQAERGRAGGEKKNKKIATASAGSSSSGASGSSSSSDSGSDSGNEAPAKAPPAAAAAAAAAPAAAAPPAAAAAAPAHAAGVPKKFAPAPAFGNLAAKMAVRTGLRCTCCYAGSCRRQSGAAAGKATGVLAAGAA